MITVIISAKDSGDLSHNFVRMSIQYHESCDDWTRRARRDINYLKYLQPFVQQTLRNEDRAFETSTCLIILYFKKGVMGSLYIYIYIYMK